MNKTIDKAVYGWLTNCPPSDINFKSKLERADEITVKAALDLISDRVILGHVTRKKALESRLRKLQKSGGGK